MFFVYDLTENYLYDLQKEFLDKYDSFHQLVAKIYGDEAILSVSEMKGILASM